jgi:hypothetical protein
VNLSVTDNTILVVNSYFDLYLLSDLKKGAPHV